MRVNVVVKTKDRSPRKNYLDETLENLRRAGAYDSSLCAGVFVQDGKGRTLHQNAQRCIERAAASDATYAMVLEDDLDFCDEFLENVVAWLGDNPEQHMYVLGANYGQIDSVVARGGTGWAYPVGAFYGAQALVWRRDVAEKLAEWLGPDPNYNGIRDHGHDLLLQRWGHERGAAHFLASAPCMVQHIGNESGIGNRFFQFPWGGRDWRYRRSQ